MATLREFTRITFAGFQAQAVHFRNARGFQPSQTTLEFYVADFPEGFVFKTLEHGAAGAQVKASPQRSRAPASVDVLEVQGKVMPVSGTLTLLEVVGQDRYEVEVGPLYVLRAEEVKRSDGGSPRRSRVRLTLVDRRYFDGRGAVPRWHYNRLRPDGSVALDSVKPDGKPFTLAEIAGELVAAHAGHPQLRVTPAGWEKETGPREFTRFSPASLCLASIVRAKGIEDPCWNLDGSLSLYATGDGRVGFAKPGEGRNTQELPKHDRAGRGIVLSKRMTGRGAQVELSYPPDYVLVVGGRTIRSFRTEAWEPVLLIEGEFLPIEEGLALLTKGQWDVKTLARWVLVEHAALGAGGSTTLAGVPDEHLELLHEQAWRLWRLRGVVERRDGTDFPGPNAHMAPLLARAETVAGRRLPLRADVYKWAYRHVDVDTQASVDEKRLAETSRQMAEQRKLAEEAASRAGKKISSAAGPPIGRLLRSDKAAREELDEARLVDSMREANPGIAAKYEQLLIERYRLEADVTGGEPRDLAYKRAQLALQKAKAEQNDRGYVFAGVDEKGVFVDRSGDAIQRRIDRDTRFVGDEQALAREQTIRERDHAARAGTGTRTRASGKASPLDAAYYAKNIGPVEDEGARIFSADACVVRTSRRSGWLSIDGSAAPGRVLGLVMAAGGFFVPKSPRITFGAHVRPRIDRPPGGRVQTQVASPLVDPAGDLETYYTALFRRNGTEAVQVELDPKALDQAISVDRDDLVELIPLEGTSNRHELDAAAREEAAGKMAKHERVEGWRLVLAHCWPILCDGVVASVEIYSRPGGVGFETRIETGSDAAPRPGYTGTRERPKPRPRQAPPDGPQREGTA